MEGGGKAEEMERRFAEFKSKQGNKQHPMYQTSAKVYGHIPKGASADTGRPAHGRPPSFTKTFLGGHFRDNGLSTSVTKSRVHKAYDGVI